MIPRMLTLLRESRGYSGAQLAKLSGVPQPTLSRLENGMATIDRARLERIADALGYPVEAFEWEDPVLGFGSSAFYHRKQQTLPQTVLRKVQAQVNLTRMRLERLLKSIEIEPRYALPVIDVEEFGSASEVARAVRALWKLPMGPVDDVAAAVEGAGVIIVRADLESPKISAISLDNVGGYPALIFVNRAHPADRERFTVAHELGHLVMHSDLRASEQAEAEADQFAAEFLMPAADIRVQLKAITLQRAAQLKPVWRVAMAALIRRARDLNLIDDSRFRSLVVSMSQKGWRKVEPVSIAADRPTVLKEALRVHLQQHGYSLPELAQVVAMRPDEFRARFDVEQSVARQRPDVTYLRPLN